MDMANLGAIALAAIGVGFCVNTICTATHLPEKAPWTIGLMVAASFATSVGVVVTALSGDVLFSFRFLLGSLALIVAQTLWRAPVK